MNEDTKALQTIDGQVLAPESVRPTMIRRHGLCRAHYNQWREGRLMKGPIRTQHPVEPYNPKKSKAK